MQTALYLTDGSVDSALSFRSWLTHFDGAPLRFTVVLPYDLPVGEPLHKSVCGPAKQAAQEQLANWLAIVNEGVAATIRTEVLFASPAQALSIHLLVRQYDYLVQDEWLHKKTNSLLMLSARMETRVLYVGNSPVGLLQPPLS